MPAFTLALKRARADGRCPVAINYQHRHAGKSSRCQMATGIVALPEHLDAEGWRILSRPNGATRGAEAEPRARQMTDALARHRRAFNDALTWCDLNKVPPVAPTVRERVASVLRDGTLAVQSPPAAEYLRELIGRKAAETTASTQKTYAVTANRLDKYAPGVRLDQMDLPWRDGYVQRLTSAGLSTGTLWAETKALRMALNDAEARDIATPGAHRQKGWMAKAEPVPTYYVQRPELDAIRDVRLPPRLDNVRDWFVLACATGMRVSDLSAITAGMIEGQGCTRCIRFRARKTRRHSGDLVIPLNADARAVLDKRDGELPHRITSQKLNEYLKEVGQAAELTRVVPRAKTGAPTPLGEALSMHDARRTFATLALREGVPSAVVMKMTGHKTEAQLRRYIRTDAEDSAADARQYGYFQ